MASYEEFMRVGYIVQEEQHTRMLEQDEHRITDHMVTVITVSDRKKEREILTIIRSIQH